MFKNIEKTVIAEKRRMNFFKNFEFMIVKLKGEAINIKNITQPSITRMGAASR